MILLRELAACRTSLMTFTWSPKTVIPTLMKTLGDAICTNNREFDANEHAPVNHVQT